jgi:hypothetical protein
VANKKVPKRRPAPALYFLVVISIWARQKNSRGHLLNTRAQTAFARDTKLRFVPQIFNNRCRRAEGLDSYINHGRFIFCDR